VSDNTTLDSDLTPSNFKFVKVGKMDYEKPLLIITNPNSGKKGREKDVQKMIS